MSETKWTNTPWEISEDDYGDELWFGGEGCGLICVNGWANGGYKEYPEQWAQLQAEARLIAAAPTMAEYIKKHADNGCKEAFEIWEMINAQGQ